jgi:hypothetical protein
MENWWNKNDWQGKRKEQVEYSAWMGGVAILMLAALVLAVLITS